MATSEDTQEYKTYVLTTNPASELTFSSTLTTRDTAQMDEEMSLLSVLTEAMPSDLYTAFPPTNSGGFYGEIVREFNTETYPSWLAQLPEAVQTYFMTRWMGAILDSTDLLGSSSSVISEALVLTTGANGITKTARGSVTLAKSKSWYYMSVLEENVPAAVLILTDEGFMHSFATAVYRQFTSGTAPSWFAAMPTDVQSFVILDFLPNKLDEPMTLDMLALASPSPAARPTAATEPTVTSTSTPSAISDHHSPGVNVAMMTGTIVAVISVALILSFTIWFFQRRKTRRARSSVNTLPPLDPERAMRRWSETTFSTTLPPHNEQDWSTTSPQMTSLYSPGSSSHPLRRALSESDLKNGSDVRAKGADPSVAASHDDRVELEALTSPLVRC